MPAVAIAGKIFESVRNMASPSYAGKVFGFIGAGQMAKALAKGWASNGVLSKDQIVMFDVKKQAMEDCAALGFRSAENCEQVVSLSDIIVIAVKPHAVTEALSKEMRWNSSKLFLSICAGIKLSHLREALQQHRCPFRLIRLMPNTPCMVGKSATAFAAGEEALSSDIDCVKHLMGTVGVIHEVSESQLDAVTGLSGSGPAFVYMMIEALSDAGVQRGLPRNVASSLAAQMVVGAGSMVKETATHPAILREHVTSPGGTTIAGVAELEKRGFRYSVIAAVNAATDRSIELSRQVDN